MQVPYDIYSPIQEPKSRGTYTNPKIWQKRIPVHADTDVLQRHRPSQGSTEAFIGRNTQIQKPMDLYGPDCQLWAPMAGFPGSASQGPRKGLGLINRIPNFPK